MTDRERVYAVGDTLFAVKQAFPAFVETFDRHEQGILEANAVASRVETKVDILSQKFDGLAAVLRAPLPPMRPESPSTLDLQAKARTEISGEFQKVAKSSGGPPNIVTATPEKLTSIVDGLVAKVLAEKEAQAKAAADAARLAEIDAKAKKELLDAEEARKQQAKDRRKIIMAALLAAAGVIGTSVATHAISKAEGLQQGHDQAVKELRAAGPTMPPPSAPASVAK